MLPHGGAGARIHFKLVLAPLSRVVNAKREYHSKCTWHA